jgi:hypothetical protein
MNQPSPFPTDSDSDRDFDKLLRSHPTGIQLPDTFQAEVWRRIETDQARTWGARFAQWIEGLFSLLIRPAGAAAAVLLMASFGAWAGLRGRAHEVYGKNAYLSAISPFAAMEAEVGK